MAPQNNGRAVAWLALAAIIFLSLVPPGVRPTTFLPHKIEHAGIFLFDGLAFGIAYLGYEWLMAVERLGGDILRRHRACPTDDSRSTRAVQRFCRRRDRCLRRYFCRLNADPDERTPLPVKSDHTPSPAKWPRPPAAIGDGRPGPCSQNREPTKLSCVERAPI